MQFLWVSEGVNMIFKIGILVIFAITSIEDIRKKEIHLWEILTCGVLSVAAEAMAFYQGTFDLTDLLLSLLPGALMLFLSFITREGIGYGDGLLILAAGPALSAGNLTMALAIAIVISGLFSGILLVLKKAGRKSKIAFAPFMFMGCLAATVCGYGLGG